VVSPNTLTDGVPKVPEALGPPFWHFWHCLTLGTSNKPQIGPVGDLLSGTLAFKGTALRRVKEPGLHRPGPSEGAYCFHLNP
jgi:hypothetical protein